jgi:hypothetical protein
MWNFLDPLKAILEALKFLHLLSDEEQRQNKDALEALMVAAYSTRAYLADARSGQKRREVERVLSEHWIKATIQLRNIDLSLADKCFLKAEYWSDPELWEDNKRSTAEIDLEQIIARSRDLLRQL